MAQSPQGDGGEVDQIDGSESRDPGRAWHCGFGWDEICRFKLI